MKSLIVEDEITSEAMLRYYLEQYGKCDSVTTGEDAIKEFKNALSNEEPYDLICLDINLPGESGIDILERIRDLEASTEISSSSYCVIFMITAQTETQNITQSFSKLCDEFIPKPITKETMEENLSKYNLID